MIDLEKITIASARASLDKGEFSAVELAEAYLEKIEAKNPEINAYIEVYKDVKEQAKAADAAIKAGKAKALTGIPLSMKDNLLIEGRLSTSASKILEGYQGSYTATAAKKLLEAGAVFLGRTNMDEFAMGGSTESSHYGITRNPHDLSRVPGGSSGGAAASIAMNGALGAIGSDTGGSIRQPASFCGLVGLKPTYGAVSRLGLMAMASSLDQIGPLAKTVEDAKILFDVMKGRDPLDSTSVEYPKSTAKKAGSFKLGIPRDFLKGVDAEVLANFNDSIEKLKKAGHEVVELSMPNLPYSLPVYYILMPAEVSSNLARFDGVKYGFHAGGKNLLDDYLDTRGQGFGREARRRIILGAYVLSSGYYDAYYGKANAVRALITEDFATAFKKCDAILLPTSPSPAFKIGEKTSDPVSMYLSDIFTVSANLAGVPAMSLPSGTVSRDGKNLPLGLQLIAPHFREDTLFALGAEFEKVR